MDQTNTDAEALSSSAADGGQAAADGAQSAADGEQSANAESTLNTKLRFLFRCLIVLFFLSGLSSLIYQVIWTRLLGLVLGSTTHATAIVLSVFMGGLALGAYIAGRFSERVTRPLLWYGILEGIIGFWAACVPFIFELAPSIYQSMTHGNISDSGYLSVRFAMAFCLLIVPTTCMGATLPLLSKFITSSLSNVGDRVGTLYAVNTLGAVAGSITGGFLLLPTIGMRATTFIAAAANWSLCLFVLWLVKTFKVGSMREVQPDGGSSIASEGSRLSISTVVVLVCFAISGAAAMIFEVSLTRSLSLVLGSTTYAFSIMLSTFLTGIFLGSWACAKIIDRARSPLLMFAMAEIMACLSGVLILVLFNYMPWWFMTLADSLPKIPLMGTFIRFGLSAIAMLPLTVCLGAVFPAVVRVCTKDLEAVGRSVGTLYSANTVGAIIGSLLAGFFLIPNVGVEKSLLIASLANLFLGVLLLCLTSVSDKAKIGVIAVACAVSGWFIINPDVWDRLIIMLAQAERRKFLFKKMPYDSFGEWSAAVHRKADLTYWHDGASSTVAVVSFLKGKQNSMITNGHSDGSDGSDMPIQVLISGYPLLWRPQTREIAVVGWGLGQSAGTATQFPIKSLTAIELEPAVLEAAALKFHHINHKAEQDPRVTLHTNDGRNFLLTNETKYDMIISEPSNPFQAGVCNLFTRQYFEICKSRLKPDGTLSVWLQLMEIPTNNVRDVLAALHKVFPHLLAVSIVPGTMDVMASDKPLTVSYDGLVASFQDEKIQHEMKRVGIPSPEAVLSQWQLSPDQIDRVTEGYSGNVDDTNRLEYAVASTYEHKWFFKENQEMLDTGVGEPWKFVDWGTRTDTEKAKIMLTTARFALDGERYARARIWASESDRLQPGEEAKALLKLIDEKKKKADEVR